MIDSSMFMVIFLVIGALFLPGNAYLSPHFSSARNKLLLSRPRQQRVILSYRFPSHTEIKAFNFPVLSAQSERSSSEDTEATRIAMENARICSSSRLSPGAGLATADEQSDAAYADLINTSMDQRYATIMYTGIRGMTELSSEQLENLTKGGRMWESGATDQKGNGLLGDIASALKALFGGAHIEKNEFGET